MKHSTSSLADMWQELLQKQRSVKPRDIEFEHQKEYEARLAQSMKRFTTPRWPFQCNTLTNWYYDLEKGVLKCQCVVRKLLPLQQIRLDIITPISREKALHYRTNPKRFHVHGQFALQANIHSRIIAVNIYLELSGEGQFSAHGQTTIEEDSEAIQVKRKQEAAEAKLREEEWAVEEKRREEERAVEEKRRKEERAAYLETPAGRAEIESEIRMAYHWALRDGEVDCYDDECDCDYD